MLKRLTDLFRGRREVDDLKKVIVWMGGRDTGLSSESMAVWLTTRAGPGKHCTPRDGSDLGRCLRFLRHMGWEHRYREMVGASDDWTKMVSYWDWIVRAYDGETAGRFPKGTCYAMMKHCEAGGNPVKFKAADYPFVFTLGVDMPGLYCADRSARGLSLCDPTYPIQSYPVGTHRYRVHLSPEAMRDWIKDATTRANELKGSARASCTKAIAALETALLRFS